MCCAATGLANVYFGLFFLFKECEQLLKWLANSAPNAAFKQVCLSQQMARWMLLRILVPARLQQAYKLLVACLWLQELASRKALREVGTELIQQSQQHSLTAASAAVAATSLAPAGSGDSQRPSAVDPGSFLALILPAVGKKPELDDLWATNQATSFILAGYETTANTLAFCIYLLATHPGLCASHCVAPGAAMCCRQGGL
jgi:cytochrome P450